MLSLARPQVDINNNPTGNTYTAAQVDARLHLGNRRMFFRYALLDQNNKFLKLITTVESASIAYDTTQPIKRTAKFTLQDDSSINFFSNRIQPFALLSMGDGYFAQFPLGIFLLSTPPQVTDAAGVITRQVEGYDLGQYLVDYKATDRYVVTSGTNYISAVQTLLSNAGFSAAQMNLTATTLTLPVARDWDPGTAYQQIIKDLLTAINYRDLWFDENGIAQATPYLTPVQRNADYTYQDDSNSVLSPVVTRGLDLFSVPNKWVVVVAQTDTAVLTSTYTNTNANSPTSTVNRGRTIVKYQKNLNAPIQQTLDSFAARLAFEDSQVYETVTLETAIMPFHSDYDVIQLIYSVLGINDKYSEIGWSFDLKAGALMQHTVRKVVSV